MGVMMNTAVTHEIELFVLLTLSAAGYSLGLLTRKKAFLRFLGPLLALGLLTGIILFKLFEPAWVPGTAYYFCFGMGLCYLMAFCIPVGIVPVLHRVPTRPRRITVMILSALVLIVAAYVPTAAAMWVRADLTQKITTFTPNGVCLQNTDYTCGPAAAVTALDQLGIEADESKIALAARTSPITGTRIGDLYHHLNTAYKHEGLNCRIRKIDVESLTAAGPALVSLKETAMLQHCVAVLDVTEDSVTLADPWIGIRKLSRQQFASQWTGRALLLSRDSS